MKKSITMPRKVTENAWGGEGSLHPKLLKESMNRQNRHF